MRVPKRQTAAPKRKNVYICKTSIKSLFYFGNTNLAGPARDLSMSKGNAGQM
jgi:hypothetical protein